MVAMYGEQRLALGFWAANVATGAQPVLMVPWKAHQIFAHPMIRSFTLAAGNALHISTERLRWNCHIAAATNVGADVGENGRKVM